VPLLASSRVVRAAILTSSHFATNPSLRRPPELLVRHTKILTTALSAGAALVVLAGCGGGGSSSSAASGTSSSSASAGTPVTGGNLVFANPQDAQSLDESTVFDNNSIWIMEQITQPLFTVTANGKSVMPWLATGYTESANGLTYTITLRKGVKFGGKTAAAFYNAPVGTGPFKFDFWHKGSALKLVKNTNYWQPGKPYLNSVTWTDVPNDNTRQLQVTGGQAQIDQFPAWSTVAQLKANPADALSLFPSTETNYLAFNEHVKPFQDVNVRQAISYAIDRDALVKAVLFGNGKPANSLFPPQVPYYDANSGGLQYNMASAKAALAKSSVPKGFTTTLTVPTGNSDYGTIATIVQSELKPLGIKVNIQTLDPNTANENFQSGKYDMEFSLWTMDIPDPDELATFGLIPTSGSKSFFTFYSNPTVVKAVKAAEVTTDSAARQADYNAAQTQAAKDAFMAFLYYSPYAYAESSNVHGFNVTPLGNYHMEDVWLSS
jgi:ABC-type transport system substrate-binding protein